MSAKNLIEKYKKARNSPDALRLGMNFNFGMRIFKKSDSENSKCKVGSDAEEFSIPVIDIAAVVAVVASAALVYELAVQLIDLIRYKKRF